MTEMQKFKVAQEAKIIVSGYAFVTKDDIITIVNLNKSDAHTCVINGRGEVLETCMDPIEQVIALKIWKENKEFLEEEIA